MTQPPPTVLVEVAAGELGQAALAELVELVELVEALLRGLPAPGREAHGLVGRRRARLRLGRRDRRGPGARWTVRVHAEQGGLWTQVDELPGCFAAGDTPGELADDLAAAVELYLAA